MRGRGGYHTMRRRELLLAIGGAALTRACTPAPATPRMNGAPARARDLPPSPWGVQTGDVRGTSAVVWARADEPGAMLELQWALAPSWKRTHVSTLASDAARSEDDLVTKALITGLPPGARVHYRARFPTTGWTEGSFSTPQRADERGTPADVTFAWSGDTNGQGWGIDPARGGMPAYRALLARSPEFFVHCGDRIYADDPIAGAPITLPDGSTWTNLVTEAKSHVAQTLDDFRGAFLYARHSPEVRALSAQVPLFAIWDDHEVRNNWFPGELLDDARYAEREIDRLAVRARRAMLEHTPTIHGLDPRAPRYRSVRWGPRLEVFFLDGRSYRAPNEPAPPDGGMLGTAQIAWLGESLSRSTATWKVVASNMPIGLVIAEYSRLSPHDGSLAFDGFANTNGPPREREIELARLFALLASRRVQNVVWLTADVHYAAAHHYDPTRAAFREMSPFWELVAGPMHATAFPRKTLDDTFGPEVAWAKAPEGTQTPVTELQSFGVVRIDGRTGAMTITFVDQSGHDLHTMRLDPRT